MRSFSRSETQRYADLLDKARKHANDAGMMVGKRPRDLLAIILAYQQHASIRRHGRHSHRRLLRPSRINEWLRHHRESGSRHITSSYFEQPPRKKDSKQELGSLREAGRDTAQFTPPLWRDCGGNKYPAQSHCQNVSQLSSLDNRSLPSPRIRGRNRRGYRSEAAHLARLERQREKRAERRRAFRCIKTRWRGLPREDLEVALHLGTPGLRESSARVSLHGTYRFASLPTPPPTTSRNQRRHQRAGVGPIGLVTVQLLLLCFF